MYTNAQSHARTNSRSEVSRSVLSAVQRSLAQSLARDSSLSSVQRTSKKLLLNSSASAFLASHLFFFPFFLSQDSTNKLEASSSATTSIYSGRHRLPCKVSNRQFSYDVPALEKRHEKMWKEDPARASMKIVKCKIKITKSPTSLFVCGSGPALNHPGKATAAILLLHGFFFVFLP